MRSRFLSSLPCPALAGLDRLPQTRLSCQTFHVARCAVAHPIGAFPVSQKTSDGLIRVHIHVSERDIQLIDLWSKQHRMSRGAAIRVMLRRYTSIIENKLQQTSAPLGAPDIDLEEPTIDDDPIGLG